MKKIVKGFCSTTGLPTYFLKSILHEMKMVFVRLYRYTPMFSSKLTEVKMSSEPSIVFGCGDTTYPGWFHVDCFFADHVDLVMDLRRRLPFENDSIAYCYSEHFLEHLYYDEAQTHLSEVYRVLKPGGVYRIVVPHARRFMEKYLQNDMDFFHLAHPWEDRPIMALYHIVNWGGDHRGIYDVDLLAHFSRQTGFTEATESSANASKIEKLRIDRSEPQRVAESLYIELRK